MDDTIVAEFALPSGYIRELNKASSYYKQSWLAITSSTTSLDQLLTDVKPCPTDKDSVPTPTPFLNSTVPQIYSHFKSYLRRPDDFDYLKHPFTHFTFLVIDQQCLEPTDSESPSGFTILLCSDGPDLHESQTRLKTLRLPIEAAFKHLQDVEDLMISPSEVYTRVFEDPDSETLALFPIPSMIHIPPFTGIYDAEQRFKPGTPAEMREKKTDAFRRIEIAQRQEVVDDGD
ncbi:MAG: hypothetical protein Q9183_001832 [Haloplaca sp. 2 TL-2023]